MKELGFIRLNLLFKYSRQFNQMKCKSFQQHLVTKSTAEPGSISLSIVAWRVSVVSVAIVNLFRQIKAPRNTSLSYAFVVNWN